MVKGIIEHQIIYYTMQYLIKCEIHALKGVPDCEIIMPISYYVDINFNKKFRSNRNFKIFLKLHNSSMYSTQIFIDIGIIICNTGFSIFEISPY